MAESEELKSLLTKMKQKSEKVDLKLNIQKTKSMESSPITLWQIDGEIMETVTDFIFRGFKITADCDYSHEVKRCLLLERKAIANLLLLLSRFSHVRLCVTPQTAAHQAPLYLDIILKSRDINLPTKVSMVRAMVFPVVLYGCESWTIKKAECQRIDAFELWCWRRLLRVPWTARRSNQSILKETCPKYSLEGLMLKLKLQYFGHLMRRTNSLEKTLMLRKIEGRRRRR